MAETPVVWTTERLKQLSGLHRQFEELDRSVRDHEEHPQFGELQSVLDQIEMILELPAKTASSRIEAGAKAVLKEHGHTVD